MSRVLKSLFFVCFILLTAIAASAQDKTKIRFGGLPVLQALPIYVAQDKGLFAKHGAQVEIIPFNTAAEKDIALTSQAIDGYFGDLVTPMILLGNKREAIIVATNYDTRRDRRMFAILAKPGSQLKTAAELAGVPVAVSSNSVIDLVTQRLLTAAGVPEDKLASVESKNIGIRLQMLLSGQVEAATLPEPLATAALAKGAVLLTDDAGLGESQTVLVFAGPFLKANPGPVKAFLAAVNEAIDIINERPNDVRPVMTAHVRLPEQLQATYPVPKFPKLHAPDKEAVNSVAEWLKKRGVIPVVLTYEQAVDASLIQ